MADSADEAGPPTVDPHGDDPSGVNAVRSLLVGVARSGETITYPDLRRRLGFSGDLVPLLRAVSESEDDADRGLLTALVVSADTGRPGEGWLRLAASRGRDVSDPEACWHEEIRRLHRLWSGAEEN